MLITVKILNGVEHALEVGILLMIWKKISVINLHDLQVHAEQSILEIKHLIFDKINIPVDQQRVMYKGKSLNGKPND